MISNLFRLWIWYCFEMRFKIASVWSLQFIAYVLLCVWCHIWVPSPSYYCFLVVVWPGSLSSPFALCIHAFTLSNSILLFTGLQFLGELNLVHCSLVTAYMFCCSMLHWTPLFIYLHGPLRPLSSFTYMLQMFMYGSYSLLRLCLHCPLRLFVLQLYLLSSFVSALVFHGCCHSCFCACCSILEILGDTSWHCSGI